MLKGASQRQYQIDAKPFSSGGEGAVYNILGMSNYVIKIYHPKFRTRELEEKILYMAKNRPSQTVLNQVAWPLDVVYDSVGKFCGFVMPKLNITAGLNEIYRYPNQIPISIKQKIILAENICVVIHAIHSAGYVFGDFNPMNIGVNLQTGLVAFLDTDSYHIVLNEQTNQAYRCKVCLDGYVAPELLKKCDAYPGSNYADLPLPTFTTETDNFALAIHIFKLLMNGFTPFNGIRETESVSTASPGVNNQAIKRDSYCFKQGFKPQALAVPEEESLPNSVRCCFHNAFIKGRNTPSNRPSAATWHRALEDYENNLKQCSNNPLHQYGTHLNRCPFCEADTRYQVAFVIPQMMSQKVFATPVQTPVTNSTTSLSSTRTRTSTVAQQTGNHSGANIVSASQMSSIPPFQPVAPPHSQNPPAQQKKPQEIREENIQKWRKRNRKSILIMIGTVSMLELIITMQLRGVLLAVLGMGVAGLFQLACLKAVENFYYFLAYFCGSLCLTGNVTFAICAEFANNSLSIQLILGLLFSVYIIGDTIHKAIQYNGFF